MHPEFPLCSQEPQASQVPHAPLVPIHLRDFRNPLLPIHHAPMHFGLAMHSTYPAHPRLTRVRTHLSPIPTRCWLTSPPAHYMTLCYAGLILLFNVLVLVAVVVVLWKTQQQQRRARRDWVTVLGLTCLLGTTWGTAFCAFGVLLVPQLYLFTVLNSLQGQHPGGILEGGGSLVLPAWH